MLPLVVALALAAPPPALDPQRLPHLPLRGLVRQTGGAVEFQSLRGRAFGRLAGFQLAQPGIPHGVLLMRGRARYTVDLLERRVRPARKSTIEIPGGCRLGDESANAALFLCGRTLRTRSQRGARVLVGPAGRVGHWAWGEFSPNGGRVLAEWSAECEIPVTFDLSVSKPKLVPLGGAAVAAAPEIVPLGWLGDGKPVVRVLHGGCGTGRLAAGVYVFGARRPQLLVKARGIAPYAMWGG